MPFSKHRRGHTFFMVIVFASLGITTEVIFTAFMNLVHQTPLCGKPLISMAGDSYVWMIFIYGLIPILGHYGYHRIKKYPVLIRLLIYVLLIYIVEFSSGYILQKTLGACPWQYTSGHQVMGLIQLDFFPFWAFFSWIVERFYVFMNERVIQ